MKIKQFFVNTVILTAASFILRFIGVAFGAYLSQKIGAEGVGLFQLIFTIYNLASTLATSGIYLAVTRLVAEEISKGSYAKANDAMRVCMIYGTIISCVASILLYCFSAPISRYLIDDERAVLSLRILAFALPFMAFSSSLRGYFFAIRQVTKSSSSQIIEQIVRMVIVMTGFLFVLPGGLSSACAAIACGSVGGEAIAFLYALTLYLKDKRKRSYLPQKQKDSAKKVLNITIPVALSSYLKSALVTIENILVPKGFKKYGASGKGALSQYGIMEAMVMPILTFPSAFLTSFSSLLVPELAESNALGMSKQIDRLASRVMHLTMIFSFPIAGAFICFSDELAMAVYKSEEAGYLLQILAPLVPVMYLDLVADAMLKGLDQQLSVLRYSMIDSSLSILLIYFLIPAYGLKGYITVMFASTFVNAVLSINRLTEITNIAFSFQEWLIKPIFAIVTALISALFLTKPWQFSSFALAASVKIGISFAIYFLLLMILGTFSPKELRYYFKLILSSRQTST